MLLPLTVKVGALPSEINFLISSAMSSLSTLLIRVGIIIRQKYKNRNESLLYLRMEFSKLILKRQSDRKYSHDKVDREDVIRCLEAARMAPSACNSQPWRFVVVDEPSLLKQISEAAIGLGMNKFTADVPVIVAVVQESMNLEAKAGALVKNKDYSMMDLGFAIDHFCLQAAELGLGTCIMGWFDEKKVKKILGVPRNRRVQLLISLGHPDAPTRQKIRKPMDQMSSWNRY